MKHPLPAWVRTFAVLASFLLLAAACGDDDEPDVEVEDEVNLDDQGIEETETETEVDVEEETETEVETEEETETATETEVETATEQARTFRTDLRPLNGSGAQGNAVISISTDGTVSVQIETAGHAGQNPHAQHLHIGGDQQCPGPEAAGDDDLITTREGVPSYGEVRVALTTEGRVDPASALAFDRFPVSDADGTVTYARSFPLPEGVTIEDIGSSVVVQHGISSLFGDETVYDGEPRSSLDPSLPLEATIPTVCGPLA